MKQLVKAPTILMAFLIFLFSCTTNLTPKYDEKIYSQVTSISQETMVFLEAPSYKINSEESQEKLIELIGKYRALELLMKARPKPSNESLNKLYETIERAHPDFKRDIPSELAVIEIIKTLKELKSDKQITSTDLNLASSVIRQRLHQALVYENFLNYKKEMN